MVEIYHATRNSNFDPKLNKLSDYHPQNPIHLKGRTKAEKRPTKAVYY